MKRPDGPLPLIIFDLDGTLYRTDSSFLATIAQIYADFGIPRPTDREIMDTVGEPFGRFLEGLIKQGFPESAETLGDIIARRERDAIRKNGELFEGVKPTLARLRHRGHTLAVCTNGDRAYASLVLGTCGIAEMFDRLKTLDTEGHTKTAMIGELRREFPDRCAIMVGDRYHDVEAGRANGCVVVGAAYGYGRDGELASADHRITSFAELEAIIASAC
jgi:phosphoglycolate phosphatase